jgi:hypothetical protein
VIACLRPCDVEAKRRVHNRSGSSRQAEIFKTDQGSQFSGSTFTGLQPRHRQQHGQQRAWRDNVFVEWLWGSVYEEVYLRAYESIGEARADISISTMAVNLIKALMTPHQIKPTSTSRHSAWRPNRLDQNVDLRHLAMAADILLVSQQRPDLSEKSHLTKFSAQAGNLTPAFPLQLLFLPRVAG